MESLFIKLAEQSITACWLIIAVIIARLILKKAPKWIFCILWALVAVRLLMPVALESRLSLIPSSELLPISNLLGNVDDSRDAGIGVKSSDAASEKGLPGESMGDEAGDISYIEKNGNTGNAGNSVNARSQENDGILFEMPDDTIEGYGYVNAGEEPEKAGILTRSMISALSWLWLAGTAGMLIYALISYIRLRRRVMTAIRLRDNIYRSEFVTTPFLLGLIRPRIYLPYEDAAVTETTGDVIVFENNAKGNLEQDREQTAQIEKTQPYSEHFATHEESFADEYVIAHEKAHIARRDHWWKPLGFVLLAVYWFNPLMWIAYILLCRDIEYACDEKVIADMETEKRRSYSEALLAASMGVIHRHIAACPLAFGEVGVKSRIKNVMNYKKPVFWIVIAALAGCVILAVCFLTNPVSDKANGADMQNGIENGTGSQNGNNAGMSANNNGNVAEGQPMPSYIEIQYIDENAGTGRDDHLFSDEMFDAVQKDWDKWDQMDNFSKIASSHSPGYCSGRFETWEEAVKFIGGDIWNPLEDAEWLTKMNYSGTDYKEFDILPHCSLEWSGTQKNKLTFASLMTGYAVDGIRVTLHIVLFNSNEANTGNNPGIIIENRKGELYTAKDANFTHEGLKGKVSQYTLSITSEETNDSVQPKLDELMNRLLDYLGLGGMPTTTVDEMGPKATPLPAVDETIPGTDMDANSDTDYFVISPDDAIEQLVIKWKDRDDTDRRIQVVTWQMTADTYCCILLGINEPVTYMSMSDPGVQWFSPQSIMKVLSQLDVPDEDIVISFVDNLISGYYDPAAGTDEYLEKIAELFDNRFEVRRGAIDIE